MKQATQMRGNSWVIRNKLSGGKATGFGYHKPSAAAQVAINNAGIALSVDIDGRGEGAIKEALQAIARALGLSDFGLIEAHA